MDRSAPPRVTPVDVRGGSWIWALIGVSVASTILVIRAWDRLAVLPVFWAEDLTVFVGESGSGLWSLSKPYAGYLHSYPRLIAILASELPFEFTKAVFLLGWFVSFVTLSLISYLYLLRLGASPRKALWIFVLIPLIPAHEVFFNLTNSQWLLGASLFLLYSPPILRSLSHVHKIWLTLIVAGVIVLGLTGPFSIFVLASRILLLAISRGRERIGVLDAPLFATSVIQAWFFAQSSRLTSSIGAAFDPLDVAEYLVVLFAGFDPRNSAMSLFVIASLSAWIVLLRRKEGISLSFDSPSRQTLFLPIGVLLLTASNVYLFQGEGLSEIASSGSRFNFILLALASLYVFGLTSFSYKALTPVLMLALTIWGLRLDTLPFEPDGYLSALRISSEGSVVFEANPYLPGHFWALQLGHPESQLNLTRARLEKSLAPESEQIYSFSCPNGSQDSVIRVDGRKTVTGQLRVLDGSSGKVLLERRIDSLGQEFFFRDYFFTLPPAGAAIQIQIWPAPRGFGQVFFGCY
jgi:hypothetical protein